MRTRGALASRLTVICLIALVRMNGQGEVPPPYGAAELKTLKAKANSADDYRKLAEYFHYQELLYRAKAQDTLDAYANYGGRYLMVTKTISRAEVANRDYNACFVKAETYSRLAAKYDAKLLQLGERPVSISSTFVSAADKSGSAGTH